MWQEALQNPVARHTWLILMKGLRVYPSTMDTTPSEAPSQRHGTVNADTQEDPYGTVRAVLSHAIVAPGGGHFAAVFSTCWEVTKTKKR